MPFRQTNPLKTITGTFSKISLDFMPDGPPLEIDERSKMRANYPTVLAFIYIKLDGKNTTELLPSAYFLLLLDHLLASIAKIVHGQSAIASWFSDPWQIELQGNPENNILSMTVQLPGRWIALKDVKVPLNQFALEVIHLAKRWHNYLQEHYDDEIFDSEKGEQFRRFEQHLNNAQTSYRKYDY